MSITPNPDRPATVPPPMSRAAKAEALLRRFTAEAHRRKWSYDRGLDDDGVPVPSDDFMALHRLGEDMRMALEELRRTEPSAVSVVPPATNQPALRDRIADAIRDAACPGECGKTEEECARERIQPFAWHHGRVAVVEGEPEMFADAVLGVLPAPADRAAGWLDAADAIDRLRANLSPSTAHRYESGLGLAATELRRLAVEAVQAGGPSRETTEEQPDGDDTVHACPGRWAGPSCTCFDPEPVQPAAEAPHTATPGEALCICGHPTRQHFEDACLLTGCDCGDCLELSALPEALEAALTKRFTALGNPFSEMRRHEQGPDGWPSSRPVGPHQVAEVLRELLTAAPAVVAQPGKETDRG